MINPRDQRQQQYGTPRHHVEQIEHPYNSIEYYGVGYKSYADLLPNIRARFIPTSGNMIQSSYKRRSHLRPQIPNYNRQHMSYNPYTQPPYNPYRQPPYNPYRQPPYNFYRQPPYNPSPQPPYNAYRQPPYNPSPQPPYNTYRQPPYYPYLQPPSNPSPQPPYNAYRQSPYYPYLQPPYNPSPQPPYNAYRQPPYYPYLQPPSNPSPQPPYYPYLQPPSNPSPRPPAFNNAVQVPQSQSYPPEPRPGLIQNLRNGYNAGVQQLGNELGELLAPQGQLQHAQR